MTKQILIDFLHNTKNWNDLKNQISNLDENQKGKVFELFAKQYFLHSPFVKDNYKCIWLYNEVPQEIKEKLNLSNSDYGIDLLLQDLNNEYCAVQVKYRGEETRTLNWSADKISNLFGLGINFINNFIVFSNASKIDQVSLTMNSKISFLLK